MSSSFELKPMESVRSVPLLSILSICAFVRCFRSSIQKAGGVFGFGLFMSPMKTELESALALMLSFTFNPAFVYN